MEERVIKSGVNFAIINFDVQTVGLTPSIRKATKFTCVDSLRNGVNLFKIKQPNLEFSFPRTSEFKSK